MPDYAFYGINDFVTISSDPAWANAREGTGASLETDTGTADYVEVGTALDNWYYCRQGYFTYNTSSVTGTVTAATFYFFVYAAWPGGFGKTFEARQYAYTYGSNTSFRSGTALGSLTLLATMQSNDGNPYYRSASMGSPASLPIISSLQIVLAATEQRTNVVPTEQRHVYIYSSERTGTSQDPYLAVSSVLPSSERSFAVVAGF